MSWGGVKKQTNIEDIKAWCEEMGIENYTINPKGEIDVDGNVGLHKKYLKELPYKFGKVNGYFDIARCENLISLKNCPDETSGYFSCELCRQLDSIVMCPKKVGKDFFCRYCKIKFSPEEIKSLCKIGEYLYV